MLTNIEIVVRCVDCDQEVQVPWPAGEYSATLYNRVTLDGRVDLPEGWYAKVGSEGGDNKLRCPVHSVEYLAALASLGDA
jgi:hypothetical protein